MAKKKELYYTSEKITDIEWHESKNTPIFGNPYYPNRPPLALYAFGSPFRRIGLQFIPENRDRIIYQKEENEILR